MKKYSLWKKFMFRFFSGTKLFLSIFFLGSSVFASSGENYLSEPVTTEKKDISVFVTKLSERLQGVFKEIISLSTDQSFFEETSDSQVEDSKTLTDVQWHMYESEIYSLAKLGVIDASREKFYPDNYLRRYELVMMLVKYRLAKTDKQLSPVVFPLRWWFFDVAQNASYAPYVAYAEQQWWLDQMIIQKDGKKIFSPNTFLTRAEVCNLLDLDMSHVFCSNDRIKRWAFAAVLFRGLYTDGQENNDLWQISSEKVSQKEVKPLISQFKTMFSFVSSQ